MLKLFAKVFDTICTITAIIIIIGFIALGAFFGNYVGNYLGENEIIYSIILGFVGFIIGFFFDVITFGFIAQVSEIRKELEKLNNK